MKDNFGREIEYMRVSITDRCNLRCIYCMPEDLELLDKSDILSYEEIAAICKEAVKPGIKKIKITGGEPLVRKDCYRLVSLIKNIKGIEQVTMTTNGILLKENLCSLIDAGLDGVNVSLNTLKRERYIKTAGRDKLDAVLESIAAVKESGLPIKINSVIMKGINDDEICSLAEFAEQGIPVRYIEMMPVGYGKNFEAVSSETIIGELKNKYGEYKEGVKEGNGPAKYLKFENLKGSIGFISAVNDRFCSTCNRIRLTSTGQLKPCLCYGESISLKGVANIERLLADSIKKKPEKHCFEEEDRITERKQMVKIGG